jgi:radical SAM protein with 4Fe4S-binding SPASM domain
MSSAHVGPVPTCATRRLATVEWQITRRRYPSEPTTDELSTEEGRAVLTEAAQIGTGRVLLSGGDPTARADLVDLVAFGASLGLVMHVLAPAAPDRVHALLSKLTAAGLRGVAVALHGADAKAHNTVSGIGGSFAATIELLQSAREAGLAIEVRTALLLGRLRGLHAMADVAASIGAARWTVLAPLGGAGASLGALTLERALTTLADLAALHRFEIAAIAAPQIVRVVRLRYGAAPDGPAGRVRVERDGIDRLFISASGEVMPSAELPVSVGHVRGEALSGALDSELVQDLDKADHLTGKCGVCAFQRLCGGSRARALAQAADLWAEDPSCAYVPKAAHKGGTGEED